MRMSPIEDPTFFGPLLAKLRKQHGLRQKDLAARMRFSRTFISQIEHGVKTPSPILLDKLILALGLLEDEAEALSVAADISRGSMRLPDAMPLSVRWELVRLARSKDAPPLGSWTVLEKTLSHLTTAGK